MPTELEGVGRAATPDLAPTESFDSENAAMLAVNRKLGYRPDHTRTELARR